MQYCVSSASACKMKAGSKMRKAMSMMSPVQLHGVCRLYLDKSSTHRHLYAVHPKPLVSEAIRPKLQPQHASLAAIRNTVQHHGRICVNHDRRQWDNVASSHRLNSNTKTASSSSSSSSSPLAATITLPSGSSQLTLTRKPPTSSSPAPAS